MINAISKQLTTGICIGAAILLAGCAVDDDFGRFHETQLRTDGAEIVGSIQEHTGLLSRRAAFHIPLTNEEHTLRQCYQHFKKPLLPRATMRDPRGTHTFAKHKTVQSFNEFILHHVKSDRLWISRLTNQLGNVIAHDRQRYDVIASSYEVTENDSRYIRVRIRENRGLAVRIVKLLDRRIAIYDKAIDYARLQYRERDLLILAPSMDKLRAQIGLFKARYEHYIFERYGKTDRQLYDSAAK